ncbi:hypothetical protein DYB32_009077 [Aphanomyces invadans]|uniref:Uncharacterized protein n=1 Tax=Aphanomyces invadans TaxID=157072 RepID=A0A418AJD0_9STRA|nr:hypothetical protein DYB32_009077 [Aphanomyces invadans]
MNRSSAEWKQWRKDDMKCVRERITPSIRDCVGKHVKSAQMLWEHLRARIGRSTRYARHLAMRDVYNCYMAKDKPVAEYLANVSRLVETARQKGGKISPEDLAWCVVLNHDAKFTAMSLFNEITEQFSERDDKNLKLLIEFEERRLTEMNQLRQPTDEAQTDVDPQDAHADDAGEPPNPYADVPYGPHDHEFEEPDEFDDAGHDGDPDVPARDVRDVVKTVTR